MEVNFQLQTEGRSLAANIALDDASSSDLATPEQMDILDAIDLPVVVVSRNCTVTRVNRAAMAVLGLTISDIGRTVGGVLAGLDNVDAVCAQVIADGAPSRLRCATATDISYFESPLALEPIMRLWARR